MGSNIAYKIVLPEWTKSLRGETLMSSKEVAGFFGFTSASSLYQEKNAHRFPKKAEYRPASSIPYRNKKVFYELKELREFERKQNQAEIKGETK